MSGLHLLFSKDSEMRPESCSSLPRFGRTGFIQRAPGQEDFIQSCGAPLPRRLPKQCSGKWTPRTSTARAAFLEHMYWAQMCANLYIYGIFTNVHTLSLVQWNASYKMHITCSLCCQITLCCHRFLHLCFHLSCS